MIRLASVAAVYFVEREYYDFDDQLPEAHLKFRFFILGDISVDQNAVDEVVQHSFAKNEMGQKEVVR